MTRRHTIRESGCSGLGCFFSSANFVVGVAVVFFCACCGCCVGVVWRWSGGVRECGCWIVCVGVRFWLEEEMRKCKDNTSNDPFSRCATSNKYGYSMN